MRVSVTDLDGQRKDYDADRVLFVNHETFGCPKELVHRDDETLVIVNVNGFSSLSQRP